MQDEFFRFFEEETKIFPMTLDIHYSKITNWMITVKKRGCAKDYPSSEIRFLRGRLKFSGAKYNAPFPSMIVIFRAGGIS